MMGKHRNDLWVFGYGSLMWRPGFDYLEAHPARIWGWHRALCVWSIHYRGTRKKPGLVLGLDRGGSCVGRVFRVAAEKTEDVKDYLYRREQITMVYCPRDVRACLLDRDRCVNAFTFVAECDHQQYARGLSPEKTAAIVAKGHGKSGSNIEYVQNTIDHLAEMGIRDRGLEDVLQRAEG